MIATSRLTRRTAQFLAVLLILTFLMGFGLYRLLGAEPDPRKATTGFAGRYNEIQEEYQARADKVREGTEAAKKDSDPETTLRLYGELLAASRQAQSSLRELSPPEQVKTSYGVMNRALDLRIQALVDVIDSAAKRDNTRLADAAQQLVSATVEYHRQRRAFEERLGECGRRCR